ncbi:hypothetical protein [Catenulispora sp. GP43]|uniref:hypothetical protein n=1 Tax=Catenulispora sp. GP43 TaxID=3156263 RepID=UPI0035191568
MTIGPISGCASTRSTNTSSVTTTDGSPGSIAVAYMGDIFSDHPMDAEPLVLPTGRGSFQALATIIEQKHVSGRNFAAGATTVTGDHATVTITGTMCPNGATGAQTAGTTTDTVTSSASPTPECVTNSDPNSTNKGFQVALQKSADGKWYIDIPR